MRALAESLVMNPVSRLTFFRTRAAVAVIELFVHALVALIAIVIGSAIMGLPYPIHHGVSRPTDRAAARSRFLGGLVFYTLGFFLSQILPGD